MALRMREYAVHADYVHIREYEGICKNEDAAGQNSSIGGSANNSGRFPKLAQNNS